MRPMEQLSQASAADRPAPDLLPRHGHGQRLAHWGVAVLYVALFLSGLALFHPFFFWTSVFFGGASFMRVIHPFLGVALAAVFFAYASRLWRDNVLVASDAQWIRAMFRFMNREGEDVPVEGKYNAGQKYMYWSMLFVVAVLLVSGILIWRPYFSPSVAAPARRVSGLLHAALAFVMFVGIGVHVYAAYWTKGSIRAMTRGTVTRAWARFHHPGWYAKLVGKDAP
jgi:formate dehydrogenase subunit gamma